MIWFFSFVSIRLVSAQDTIQHIICMIAIQRREKKTFTTTHSVSFMWAHIDHTYHSTDFRMFSRYEFRPIKSSTLEFDFRDRFVCWFIPNILVEFELTETPYVFYTIYRACSEKQLPEMWSSEIDACPWLCILCWVEWRLMAPNQPTRWYSTIAYWAILSKCVKCFANAATIQIRFIGRFALGQHIATYI